jgi:predicted nucleic acid-binding protein
MPDKVADASLLGAVVFEESRSEEGVALLEGADLYEPTLLPYELSSIARKKILQHPEQREALLRALAMALSLDIRWVEVDHLQVVNLALETGHSTGHL